MNSSVRLIRSYAYITGNSPGTLLNLSFYDVPTQLNVMHLMFQLVRYLRYRSTLLIRLLNTFRKPTMSGFALLGAHPIGTVAGFLSTLCSTWNQIARNYRNTLICKQIWFCERLIWNPAESLVCDVSRRLNVLQFFRCSYLKRSKPVVSCRKVFSNFVEQDDGLSVVDILHTRCLDKSMRRVARQTSTTGGQYFRLSNNSWLYGSEASVLNTDVMLSMMMMMMMTSHSAEGCAFSDKNDQVL
ncbi:hypothetical protein CSKR_100396 [Clonorchis sinensis]|uniref:Uncharacterized protein n=1 Tax=Clonorchis sinensis TaxID=79923 RepID=A0A3R7G1P4_CLOSI|nr:hypothetical protein CSKR_100396 [Clonorchis sinensis]